MAAVERKTIKIDVISDFVRPISLTEPYHLS